MGSLTTCLRKVGDAPRAADKDAIVARARELRAGGMATDAASRQAATELLQDVRADIKALSEPRAPKDSTHPKTVMGSELLAAVSRRLGGLDPAWLAEFSTRFETGRKDKQGRPVIQWRNPMVPGVGLLFRRGGTQDLQAIAEVAEAEGYLEPGAVERDAKDAGERAKDMIRAALERKVVERLDNQIDEAQARMDAEREAYYAELDAESAREAEAERAALMAEAKMSRAEMGSLSDDDLGIDFAPLERQNTPDEVAAGMRAMGFTEQEIADELASRQPATAPAQAGPAETGQARPESAQAPRGAGEDAPRAEGSGQGLTLSAQTPEDLRAKAERESAAAKADAAEQKRLADKAKADAKRNEFTLTGSDRPADVAAAAGQGGLFDGPSEPAAAPPTKPAGANNTVFTQSDAEKARALLRKKLGQFNSGIDPEMLQAGITLAGYHIEAGARTFAKFVRAMVDDLGEAVRPYLKSWYAAVSFDPRAAAFTGDMTPVAEVATIDVDAITTESSDVPSTDAGMERDRADGAGAPRAVGDAVPADAGGTAAGPAAARIQPGEGGRGRANDPGILAGGAVPAGVGGDQRVPGADRAGLPEEFPAGSERPGRGDDARDGGIPPQHVTAGDVAKDAGAGLPNESRLAAQRAAERIPVVPGDAENILATLPYLLSGQQEDVGKAEARFAQPDGYGMLFTNGTGTGKTFTALGMVKRFARQGKTNTLIVVPDDKIMADWVASAKALDLTVTPLKSTKDAGSGITITTYANLGDNAAVAGRDWDLVVPDEAHSLSQGKDGSPTKALDVLRAITHHPRGAYTRYSLLNAADIERLSDLTARITGNVKIMNNPDTMDEMLVSLRAENVKLEAQQSALVNKLDAARKAVEQDVKARQGARRTRVLMLSATPFAYEKSVDLAEGYLFDYTDGYPYEKTGSRPYNQPDPHDYFFMTHFGYRMRVNKLTEPDDPKLDRGLLQRQFNGWLKKQGVLSQRSLDVAADYDRRFVLVDSAVGNRIDEALAWVSERSRKEAESNRERKRGTEDGGFASLEGALRDQLYGSDGYLVRRYLLEAIKAKEIIPHVREHMAMGRKVVVFHDFNKGGSRNPFALTEVPQEIIDAGIGLEGASGDAARKAQQYNDALAEFKREYPDLTGGELLRDLISPIERFRREFPDVLLVNGLEKKRDLLARYRLFNDDAAGPQVMLVQSEKNKGWSGHDTTGKHQRVLFNLGLPTKPTMAIQQEGRIYRTGQVSDALFRYLNTGTNWERWAFAQTIAQRASVADNLGSGESARALRDAFISGFEESGDFRAGHEGEGKGGKERDRIVDTATTDFDRAKSFYRGTQKKTSRTKAEEGADYFATPEPLGLKMVQWLDLRGGESSLEPSGGHGAIARWLPDNVDRTAIEPSMTLRSRMALVFEGKIVPTSFEDFHIVNKFDGVGMNPPFGTAGRLAIEHLAKATQHLRDGGRVAAIIPTGPAADAKFDKWLYALDDKGKPLHPDLHLVADIRLPAVTFERAGTAVSTRVVIIDKGKDAPQAIHRDLSDITSIEELFNRIEDMEVPKRLKAEAAAPDPAARPQPAADARAQAQADKAAAQEDGEQIAQRLGLQVIEHVTKGGAGKTLRGVLRPDLKPAQAQEVDAYTFKKDGAQFIRLEHMAEMVRKYPPPGTVAAEERAVYAVNEPTGTDVPLDLFPESLQGLQALPAEPRAGGRGRPGSAAAGDVQPAAAVPAQPNTFAEREDPQFPGLYHYSTQLVQVGQRELPVAKVENWQQAASALAAMGRYAVEHFDVLITDANGKPLAVVGAFKGAQAQAPVYPSTVLAEALRIKGAAKAWGVHNHPSGDASLSRADEHLSNTLAQAFGPSTVDWMGIAAIGGDKFSAFDGVRPYYDSLITGPTKATVPVVERTITPGNQDMPKLENPPTARKVAGTIAAGRSGVLFTDVQHRVTAFVPLESAHAKELRKDGRFDRLINAASNAGAGAAVIVNQAEGYDTRTLENIASALRLADIRVLDAVDPARGTSLAQQGLEPRGNLPVLSRVPQTDSGAFKRWFGDSKVVDADGKPLVVYHGTTGDVEAFDLGFSGADGVKYGSPAIFATSDQRLANDYAVNKFDRVISDAMRALEKFKNENPGTYDERYEVAREAVSQAFSEVRGAGRTETGGGANVMPLFMALRKPLVVDAGGQRFMQVMPEAIARAMADGRDGLIVNGVRDHASPASDYPAQVMVAFRPEQIKSAIGNRGTFDPADPDIRMKRGTGPGADIATLKPHIDAIAAKLQGLRAPVQVVSTVFDLPGDIVAALRSMNAMGTTRGLRMPDGRVFLVADKLRDQAEAEFVLFHELFGHEGIRALLDEAAYARELTKLKLANPALASEANQWFASYGADQIAARVERGMSELEARKVVRLLAIEEALSDRAGKNEPLKGWQAFMAAIQKALRAVGAEDLANWLESRTQAETMALLMQARKAITNQKKVHAFTTTTSPLFQRVWHGTPHEFDKFDTSKIGTGEGAQAYGYGLYFASLRKVAEHYRKVLSKRGVVRVNGKELAEQHGMLSAQIRNIADAMDDGKSFEEARQQAVGDMQFREAYSRRNGYADDEKEAAAAVASLKALTPSNWTTKSGQLLEVEIPEDSEMLLWDRPLSEQPEAVRTALERLAEKDLRSTFSRAVTAGRTGEVAYKALSQESAPDDGPSNAGPRIASDVLAANGIRGIKYLDGVSRNKPLRDVKREFLAELPEDADFNEVMDLIGTGTFSPKNEVVLRALADNDWLGFDYPAQAISTALSNQLANFDPSPELLQAVAATQDDSTYNYVIFSGDDVVIQQALLSRRPPPLAPSVAVLRDETGTPAEFVGPRVVLAYPQETERFEVIPEPGQKILSYAIMPTEGFDALGFVELLVENGRPVSLLDIEVQPYKRQAGTGAAVIETLLAADPKAELHISNIVESARGFWERMGVPQQNRAHGEAYDGILDWNTFAQAQDQRAAQSLGRRSAARVAEPDRDGQSPDRRGPGDAQGDGGGQADFPALSRVPPRDPVTEAALRKAGISGRQSLSDKVRAAYGRAIDAIRSHDAIADEFTQGALDQFYGIKKAVTKTVGGLGVEQDPYVTARLANGGTSSVMRGLLLHGQAKWAGNGQHLEKIDGTKGLLDILRPLGDDLNDWFGWMIGNRAERLAREGRENNLSADEIKALQALATPERAPVFKKAAVEYAAFKRSVLNVAQDAGLIDGEARKAWDHADYIPFYREIDERSTFSPTGRKGLAGQSSGIRQLKGGESSLNDPMENLLMNFSRLIDASLKNNAIRKTIDTLGETDLVKKVGYDMRTSIVPKQQVKKILAEAGTPQGIIAVLPDAVFEGMAKMWAIQAPTDPNVVRVMRGGRPEFYSVSDPLLLRALTSFVPFDFPGLVIMRAAKRVLTATVTATPEFMARNFIRDSMASQAITKSPFNPVESLKGIKRSYAEQGGYESMLFAGASFQSGNVNSGNPESTAVHMRRALRERGMDASSVESFMGSIIDYTAAGWEKYRQVGEAIENANREAVYEGAKKAGKSPTEAAYEAKDLMDFSLRGSWAGYQLLADVLPFFNARVQGLYRVGRSDPKRLAVVGGVMLAATMALAMANAGEPWYEELEDWDKDGYWHFKVKGKHFRIPKPFELGVIFATVPERIGRGVMGLDSPKRTISRVWANVRDQLAFDPVPQLFRPALDAWANKDSFRDRPIEGMGDEGKPVHARYNERTSDTMRILADTAAPVTDAAGLSPKKLEFLVNGYFGTAGMYALALSDAAVRSIEGGPVRPQMRVDDLPVVRAFYREDPARSTVFASDVYKMHSEIEQIVREYRSLKGPNASPADEAKAEKLKADNKAKFDARNDLTIATDKMRTINKKMTGVYSDTKMTAAEKRVAIDQLQLEKNNAARDAATAKVVKDAF